MLHVSPGWSKRWIHNDAVNGKIKLQEITVNWLIALGCEDLNELVVIFNDLKINVCVLADRIRDVANPSRGLKHSVTVSDIRFLRLAPSEHQLRISTMLISAPPRHLVLLCLPGGRLHKREANFKHRARTPERLRHYPRFPHQRICVHF